METRHRALRLRPDEADALQLAIRCYRRAMVEQEAGARPGTNPERLEGRFRAWAWR